MSLLIIAVALSIVVAGLILLLHPAPLLTWLERHSENPAMYTLAIVVRLALGVLLVTQSGDSGFPLVIEILGWLSIFAAAVIVVIGRRRFVRLITWAMSIAKSYARIGGIVTVGFGAFLAYAFI